MKYALLLLIVPLHFLGFAQSAVTYESFVSSGLSKPVALAHAGDSRMFVCEQHTGKIKIINSDGSINPTDFLDIGSQISTGNEQGLLGLAFHPNYSANGYFYVYYTTTGGDVFVCRFTVSGNPDVANKATETLIIRVDQPFTNHNGGTLKFGPDGYLYIGVGDGGSGGDPFNYAQDRSTLLGKMLRIDIDGAFPYGIPGDNPFVLDANTENEIWALGLRNPWKFSFDSETNDLWIADVGQNSWEEIDFTPASSTGGENYGWRCYEGNHTHNTSGCAAQGTYEAAAYEYERANGKCSVTGGYVYRGGKFSDIGGHYFFADYCSGDIWSMSPAAGGSGFDVHTHANYGAFIVGFGEDINGQLYVIGANGTIKKIETPNVISSTLDGQSDYQVSIYPNPTNGFVTVASSFAGTVRIHSVSGEVVYQGIQPEGESQITTDLQPGLYSVEISDGSNLLRHKLVVQ